MIINLSLKKLLLLFTAAAFLLFFTRYIIKGKDSVVLIHDNLDRVNLIGIFDKTFNGEFFPDGREDSFYFPGEKEEC